MSLEIIREHFSDIGRFHTSGIYSVLSKFIATEPRMSEMVEQVPLNRAPPLVFFGAIHALLLSGIEHPLCDFYPSTGGKINLIPELENEICDRFKDFYSNYENEIAPFMLKNTQTNEVRRSFVLLPAISEILERERVDNLSLVEIGCSAGLILNIDNYQFDIQGTKHKFQLAANIFKENSQNIIMLKGRFEQYLDFIVEKTKKSEALLIYSVWVLYQFSQEEKNNLFKHLELLAKKLNKKIYFLHDEWPEVEKLSYANILLREILPDGYQTEKKICRAGHHCQWLEVCT